MLPFSYPIPHSSYPFFIHEVNFTFSPSIAPTPNSYYCSPLYPLKIISLSVGHLISILLCYNSFNLITPLLILVHVLLTVGLWGGVIFGCMDLLLGLCSFVQAAPAQQHKRCGGWTDPQSTSGREGSIKERFNSNQNPITSRKLA